MSADLDRLADECFPPVTPLEPFLLVENGSSGSSGARDGSSGAASPPGSWDGSSGAPDDEDRTAARAAVLGFRSLSESSPCAFDACAELASLHPSSTGHWKYRCACLGRDCGLSETYGLLAYSRVGKLYKGENVRLMSDAEYARWSDRLDWEAGLLPSDRRPRPVVLPDGLPDSAVTVAKAMGVLVGLRDPDIWPPDEPFAFAKEFGPAYCGLTYEAMRHGLRALQREGIIELAGESGGFRSYKLWRLTAAAAVEPRLLLDVLGSEDAIVAAFVREFDAVEVEPLRAVTATLRQAA